MQAGALGPAVIASSIAVGAIQSDNQIAAGTNISDSKLAQITSAGKVSGTALTSLAGIPAGAGLIPNPNIDISSVTKQGNTFNAANKLLKLDAVELPHIGEEEGGAEGGDGNANGNGASASTAAALAGERASALRLRRKALIKRAQALGDAMDRAKERLK